LPELLELLVKMENQERRESQEPREIQVWSAHEDLKEKKETEVLSDRRERKVFPDQEDQPEPQSIKPDPRVSVDVQE